MDEVGVVGVEDEDAFVAGTGGGREFSRLVATAACCVVKDGGTAAVGALSFWQACGKIVLFRFGQVVFCCCRCLCVFG